MKALDIRLYSRAARPTTGEARAVELVRSRLEEFAQHLRRVFVRLEQRIIGPGKVDQACRVEVTLTKVADAPQFVVEGRAPSAPEAIELAADAAASAVRREVEVTERKRGRASRKAETGAKTVAVERSTEPLEEPDIIASDTRHFTPRSVKTAHPRRGRHIHKTQRQARATSAREVSATKPSRKSTRRSANRMKRDSNLARRTERKVSSPEARAGRPTG